MGISLHKCQKWKEGQDLAYDRLVEGKIVEKMTTRVPSVTQ